MRYRDRIIDLRRVRASELVRNNANWRRHPSQQRQALRGILAEIGFADAVLARPLPDGRLELIDGHMRADEALDQEIPVLVVDLDDDEAKKLLAVLDNVTTLAETDPEALNSLLLQIEADDAELRRLLDLLADSADKLLADEENDQPKPKNTGPAEMELLPHEHYDYVLVLARTTRQWNRLADLLGFDPKGVTKRKLGIGRGIEAGRLIAILEGSRHGTDEDCGAQPQASQEHGNDSPPVANGDDLRCGTGAG